MSSAGVDAILFQDQPSPLHVTTKHSSEQSIGLQRERFADSAAVSGSPKGPRRTPRKSLIVVLPENHVVSPDLVSNRLAAEGFWPAQGSRSASPLFSAEFETCKFCWRQQERARKIFASSP
jgi:hypothetical protein